MRLLEVSSLTLQYSTQKGVLTAVDDVSFTLDAGEAVGVVGESGCGKTSLALSLMKLVPRNTVSMKGSILLGDLDLFKISEAEFRGNVRWKKISMVFQGAMNSFNPVTKVGDQVAEPLRLLGSRKEEALRKVAERFRQVGLSDEALHRYPHELSGGMKQRVMIAMALILEPSLVILDEPTSALDVSVQAQITNLLKELKAKLNLSMIFITHDIALVSDLCDRIAVMYAGQVVEEGSAEQVLLAPKHPYTEKLLLSTTSIKSHTKPDYIEGSPPDMVNPPAACRFNPRCKYVLSKCRAEAPMLIDIGGGRLVRCWLTGD